MAGERDWEALEKRVRTLSSLLWNCASNPEEINGVRCDAVLKPKSDYWVLIEVSLSKKLQKLREDVAKFGAVRPWLNSQNIYAECYFICAEEPTESVVKTGKGHNVNVLSLAQFERMFLDFDEYFFLRAERSFGSAVDPMSGRKDKSPYVNVTYEDIHRNKKYDITDLQEMLLRGSNIILIGNYGTGKSRCIQELFTRIGSEAISKKVYPIAINLRENWGLRRRSEVVRRHFEELGVSGKSDAVLKILDLGGVRLLLDGFDEIASQAWSDDPGRLKTIRADSLSGIKDLISTVKKGIFIAGREHYFNSDQEMFDCLGLSPSDTVLIRCAEEFSEEQMKNFLENKSPEFHIPKWLPKRPLVIKMLLSFNIQELQAILSERGGEHKFWYHLLDGICEREARIHPSLVQDTIRSVLLEIAHISREKPGNVGPISLTEINDAFERVVELRPRDEASAMLQRLPMLGRTDPGSSDRQFLDTYILDGLRATALIESISLEKSTELINKNWRNPLESFGRALLADHVASPGNAASYLRLCKKSSEKINQILPGDIVSAMLSTEGGQLDFENLVIKDSHLGEIFLADSNAKNIIFEDCIVEQLHIGPVPPQNIVFRRCIIRSVHGLSTSDPRPTYIQDSQIESYDALSNVAKIREAKLSREQTIFCAIIQKTFFQPGGGRKEEALLRGLGDTADKRAARSILQMLMKEGILDKFPGDSGVVYIPIRKHTQRMAKILSALHHSTDPLWEEIKH
ncbi:MAG: hypothetical protein GVY13_14015 [Alphaproteobacteria bacterium]|jgi:hypothetical protein|nr:hypothetical protein [Alphaproteobacteria bacterium]